MTYLPRNEAEKSQQVSTRLRAIFRRDGTGWEFVGSEDYLVRSVIEALNIGHLFYDAPVDPTQPLNPQSPESPPTAL